MEDHCNFATVCESLNPDLEQETQRLSRSWARHEAGWLRDYLVSGVEDPRLNAQSILARHFLVRDLAGSRFEELIQEEYRFAAALDWLVRVARLSEDPEGRHVTLYALTKGADNAEGLEIPAFVQQIFSRLPRKINEDALPNYLEEFLKNQAAGATGASVDEMVKNTFAHLWERSLASLEFSAGSNERPREAKTSPGSQEAPKVSVVEPACGSANDYRFLQAYGIARLIDYSGFDLCPTNVENARNMFPGIRFTQGNVFRIEAPDKSYDLCVLQDLLEHLSITGMENAVREICRVSRRAACVGFFQMDELPDHVVRPIEEYHWNLLSRKRMAELFARHGFEAQMIHIGSFLGEQVGWPETHNPNAYTFILRRL